MGNAQSNVFEQSIFNPKGTFYDAYKDPDILQELKKQYEEQIQKQLKRDEEEQKKQMVHDSRDK